MAAPEFFSAKCAILGCARTSMAGKLAVENQVRERAYGYLEGRSVCPLTMELPGQKKEP